MKIKIKKKTCRVGIIGLGYVGLELAINIAQAEYVVLGFDKNIEKVQIIRSNKSPIVSISNKKINILEKKKYLYATRY
jgi:UDP-N-acetyl-D-glucosamine dehydrogenase